MNRLIFVFFADVIVDLLDFTDVFDRADLELRAVDRLVLYRDLDVCCTSFSLMEQETRYVHGRDVLCRSGFS